MGETDWLKRELLLYDKVGLIHLSTAIKKLYDSNNIDAISASTYEYLQDNNAIYEPTLPILSNNINVIENLKKSKQSENDMGDFIVNIAKKVLKEKKEYTIPIQDFFAYRINSEAFLSRAVAISESEKNKIIATPILTPKDYFENDPQVGNATIIQAVIKEFPVPSALVPFDEIMKLRNDAEFIQKRNALRSWMRRISNSNWNENDIREELRYLLYQYGEYMRIQKIKYTTTSLSGILKFIAGITEDIIKIKLKDATEAAFTLFKENIQLTEAELLAPGREVSYIHALRERLSSHNTSTNYYFK
jgi:hypothetical protein